jgi:hypothetical protein
VAKKQIKALAKKLEIPFLVHFTRLANLESILRHGIYPIGRISEIKVHPEINDELRLDGHLDGTSLSIAFTNNRMFWRYRQQDPTIEWAVLAISPGVVWEKDCAFCRHNAADGRISCQEIDELKTLEAFAGMFEEIEGVESRAEQKLKTYDPTDVQAEVLVFDVIEPEYIGGIQFLDAAGKQKYAATLGDRQVIVGERGLFATRNFKRKFGG